jgi:2-keto-4-pentenoate hydratase/2-oxohepta-3-ene-1,7-dioic acid hydratase in catechol pathway
MKALSFEYAGRKTYGVRVNNAIYEADEAIRSAHADLRSVLAAGALGALRDNLDSVALDTSAIDFLPVIPRPDKLICVGVNYRPHMEEMGRELPDKPVLFVRFAGSQVGHEQPLVRPRVSSQYDFEGELALIIGQRCRHVARSDAFSVIAGYSCFMDGSVRDWQRHTAQFTPGKNFRASGALGPWLTTPDEIDDVRQLELLTRVNGSVMQSARLDDLIFDIPALIE